MNRDDIIRMAREAGLGQYIWLDNVMMTEMVERFAALVAAAERKACARLQYEIDQLKRENSILRQELKLRLSAEHWELNDGMSDEEADRLAERDIVHLINHNEGAE